MDSIAHWGSLLLMAVFAAGVIGCAVTIPICAFKFFAILFEHNEQQPEVTGYRMVPVYANAEPADAPPPPAPGTAKPRARGAAAGK